MALPDVLLGLSGALSILAGAYLISFRPLTLPAALLGASLGVGGIGVLLFPFLSDLFYPVFLALLFNSAAAAAFIAIFPRQVRRSLATTFALGAAAAWHVLSAVNLLSGGVPHDLNYGMFDHLLMPGSIGGAIVVSLLVLARIVDLGMSREPVARGARIFFITPLLILFVGGGNLLGQVTTAAFGVADFPTFLQASSPTYRTIVGVVEWWIIPALIVAYAIARPRWSLPGLLMLAGFVTFLPLAFSPDMDPAAAATLRLWGLALTPALVMYAQARYRPLEGEPVGVTPTLVATGAAAFLAYLFVFVAALVVFPGDIGMITGAILGLVAGVVTARVVLPSSRRDDLRRMLEVGAGRPLQPGATVLGRYRIERVLAEGSQARLYEATDRRRDGQRVALKAIPGEGLRAEAEAIRGLEHPNIIRLHDVVTVPGFTVLVLDYAEGGNLRALLARTGGKLSVDQARQVADGILAGLAEAHAKGIVHRDVKPENVVLGADGTPKLVDFGIARTSEPMSTLGRQAVGTLEYLAPEQVRGEAVDARTDVYSAGVLIHELLTGRRPIEDAGDDFLTRRAILTSSPRIEAKGPVRLVAAVLRKALAKEPHNRFADAADLRKDLAAAFAQSPA